MTRRQALKTTVQAAAACVFVSSIDNSRAQSPGVSPTVGGPFTLPPLPYPADALEPYVDARTMEIHHDKHHATYVANLNKALVDYPYLGAKSIEDLLKDLNAAPEKVRQAVRNMGGGHYNHSLFWQMMKKEGGEPKGELVQAIEKSFGSVPAFKDKFAEAATKVFGSGWAWLVLDGKELKIEASLNQDTPLSQGKQALLCIDVWEHAYYLKYQNRRPEYIAAWLKVINWDYVSDRYAKLNT